MEEFISYPFVNTAIVKKKSLIDINKLLNTISETSKKPDSLFTPYDVGSAIIKELQKFEEKDNIFFEKNIIIENVYTIIISNFSEKHPELKLKLVLDKDYYPLVPPDITIFPSIDPIFLYELINSPDLDIRNTSQIRNIDFVLNVLRNRINEYTISYTLNSELTNEILKLLKNNNFRLHKETKSKETSIKSLSGIGYGCNTNWDVSAYLNNLTRIKNINEQILESIVKCMNHDFIEIHNRFNLYQFWIDLLEKYEVTDEKYYNSIKNILLIIKYLNLKIKIPILDMFQTIEDKNQILIIIKELCKEIKLNDEKTIQKEDEYIIALKELQFDEYNYVETERHGFVKEVKDFTSFAPKTLNYIMIQYQQLMTDLPLTNGSGIFFRRDSDNLSLFKFLIIPNEDTPYKYGCFTFDVHLSSNFPNEPPKVIHVTSKKNSFRFNPNLYADGKVCLSLLGTWTGNQSEKWIAPTSGNNGSTFLQLMLSIYSMIFTEFPWYNEPGRESGISNASKNSKSIEYNKELIEGTLKYAIIQQLKYPEYGFENVIKSHFKLKKNEIISYMEKENSKLITLFNELIDKY